MPLKSVTDILFSAPEFHTAIKNGGGLQTWLAVNTAEFPAIVVPTTIPDPLEDISIGSAVSFVGFTLSSTLIYANDS